MGRRGGPPAIDLFSGCGGTSLGLEEAGFDLRTAVEIDSAAAESYVLNVGLSPLVADIRKVTGVELLKKAKLRRGECFLLAACPPCQGFSSHRRGAEATTDERNLLVLDMVRIVEEVRPAYVLLENVPGLEIGVGKEIYGQAVARLRVLGYEVVRGTLEAADFGVPQRRLRFFAIAHRRGVKAVQLPTPTHVDPTVVTGQRGRKKRWRTVKQTIGRLPRLKPGTSNPRDPLHSASTHSKAVAERIRAIPADGGSRASLPDELVLKCHRTHDGHRDVYGRMWWGRPAPTLTGGCIKPSKGRFLHPSQHRGITLREAALLQSFPKTARFSGSRERIAEQIGNAVPPRLVAAVAKNIAANYSRPSVRKANGIGGI
jgi:DNA (cytosine-5)-methyltransferase 1